MQQSQTQHTDPLWHTPSYAWPLKQQQDDPQSPTIFDFAEDDSVFIAPNPFAGPPTSTAPYHYSDAVLDSPFLLDHASTPSPTFAQIEPPAVHAAPYHHQHHGHHHGHHHSLSHDGHPQQQLSRPLLLAHRTSLPISIPSSPYRHQGFIQHSAPAAYSPIRMVHTTPIDRIPASPIEDDAGRKRRQRSPEPADLLVSSPTDGLGRCKSPCPTQTPSRLLFVASDAAIVACTSAPADHVRVPFVSLAPPAKSELHPPKQAPSTWQVRLPQCSSCYMSVLTLHSGLLRRLARGPSCP